MSIVDEVFVSAVYLTGPLGNFPRSEFHFCTGLPPISNINPTIRLRFHSELILIILSGFQSIHMNLLVPFRIDNNGTMGSNSSEKIQNRR